jgi:hypothetical protein
MNIHDLARKYVKVSVIFTAIILIPVTWIVVEVIPRFFYEHDYAYVHAQTHAEVYEPILHELTQEVQKLARNVDRLLDQMQTYVGLATVIPRDGTSGNYVQLNRSIPAIMLPFSDEAAVLVKNLDHPRGVENVLAVRGTFENGDPNAPCVRLSRSAASMLEVEGDAAVVRIALRPIVKIVGEDIEP